MRSILKKPMNWRALAQLSLAAAMILILAVAAFPAPAYAANQINCSSYLGDMSNQGAAGSGAGMMDQASARAAGKALRSMPRVTILGSGQSVDAAVRPICDTINASHLNRLSNRSMKGTLAAESFVFSKGYLINPRYYRYIYSNDGTGGFNMGNNAASGSSSSSSYGSSSSGSTNGSTSRALPNTGSTGSSSSSNGSYGNSSSSNNNGSASTGNNANSYPLSSLGTMGRAGGVRWANGTLFINGANLGLQAGHSYRVSVVDALVSRGIWANLGIARATNNFDKLDLPASRQSVARSREMAVCLKDQMSNQLVCELVVR